MLKFKLFVLLLSITHLANAWGFYAHKEINRLAVYTLPPPLIALYKNNIKYITDHAVDADKRRYIVKEEACRHYLDGDHYEKTLPFDTLPKYWHLAVEMYGEDSLNAHGIVQWHVYFTYKKLIKAFENKDAAYILKLSADLGHYVGDLHVPLHTTSNYNGQLTGQEGIHALWESRLPPMFDTGYDFFVGKAQFFEKPMDSIWQVFERSHFLVDSVLMMEKLASSYFSPQQKYTYLKTNYGVKKDYSEAFSKKYNALMQGMVEERMTKAVLFLGCLWYSAWLEAGQPNFEAFPNLPTEEENTPIEQPNKEMIGRKEE